MSLSTWLLSPLDGIARSVEREHDMVLVAEATNGNDAVIAFRQHKPDVCLIDLQMPELNGIETIRKIREIAPVRGASS
jgi:YesN/AraC family two-component response regulator